MAARRRGVDDSEPPRVGRFKAPVMASLAVAAIAGWGVFIGAVPSSAATPAHPSSVATTPVRIAQTPTGPIGYRMVGRGSPFVLITGFSASMDDWLPTFVDALALHHRVVVFDNAGVGATGTVTPLNISAMADQTSALIDSLKLGRTAVLGWSMGGMVAQALTVLHPSQVSRLVLAATQAGTGKALPVPAAPAAAAASTNPAKVLSVLFPASQTAAVARYVQGILKYPGYYTASPAIKAAQTTAIQQWLAGRDPPGRRISDIRVPTLVADGTADELDPEANDRLLARSIHDAQLVLYPEAGHGFLFQDASSFTSRVGKFLH